MSTRLPCLNGLQRKIINWGNKALTLEISQNLIQNKKMISLNPKKENIRQIDKVENTALQNNTKENCDRNI